MAGNKEILELPPVPSPDGGYLYLAKGGLDYRVPVGGAFSLLYTDATGTAPIATIPNLPASKITSGTFANAQIAVGNVTQHQGALSIGWGQLTSVPGSFTPAAHTHPTTDITSGTFADARIAQSNVTQHQGALGTTTSTANVLVRRDGSADIAGRKFNGQGATFNGLGIDFGGQTALDVEDISKHIRFSATAGINYLPGGGIGITFGSNPSYLFTPTLFSAPGAIRGRVATETVNGAVTFNLSHVNKAIEKSDTGAYTYTIAANLGVQGDILTVINSGTSGDITVARAGGVSLFKGTTDANITVPPGTSANLYRSATANRWIAL